LHTNHEQGRIEEMKIMQRVCTIVLIVLITQGIVHPQAVPPSARTQSIARLDRYLDSLAVRGFSGSVLVELDGTPAVVKGYGWSDRERGIRNTPATVFDIGSITKQFTSAAIMTLEARGALRLDDTLGKYFPRAPKDKAGITLHQVLRHASGLPSNIGRDYDPISARAFVDSLMKAPLRFTPGSRFSYSNIGYSLLAMIVEKV
jgi:CubicO group peptidase (beta-lactamase class C family)